MHREGHIGAALALYAPLGFVVALLGARQLAAIGAVVAAALATLPNQDRNAPAVTHRGITHTVWFAVVVGVALAVAGAVFALDASFVDPVTGAAFGFVLGVLTVCSHIAADALTPAGVRPLAPVDSRTYTFALTAASNPIANYGLLALGGGLALGALLVASSLA